MGNLRAQTLLQQCCVFNQFSKEGVKETIREIMADHAKDGKKLSDQKISDLLSQRGIDIARRTVTKYRLELAKEYA